MTTRFAEPCPGNLASAEAAGGGYTTMNVLVQHNCSYVSDFKCIFTCFRPASADLFAGYTAGGIYHKAVGAQ